VESRGNRAVLVVCSLALVVATTGVLAHGEDQHHAGHDDTFGKPGDPAKVSRTLKVDMTDAMRFSPSTITVKKGETIRFLVKNSGTLKHEMVLGTAKELREHAELMKEFPEMEHEDPNQISLDGGKEGELIWQFTRAGTFDFACLQPGHFDAGMRGKVAVR
jgi:uncharacterized cupredoxin-like copper-binding protein